MTVIASHATASTEPSLLNIAAHLPRMAGRHPDQSAVIHPKAGAQLTFRQLNEDCDRYAWGLSRLGIGHGTHAPAPAGERADRSPVEASFTDCNPSKRAGATAAIRRPSGVRPRRGRR